MRGAWLATVVGVAAGALGAGAAVELASASQGAIEAPVLHCGPLAAGDQPLWVLLEELVRLPGPMRADRAQRIAWALRDDRTEGEAAARRPAPPLMVVPLAPRVAPPAPEPSPESEPKPAPDPEAGNDLASLLATYRRLSPATKDRLAGLDADALVRAVERLAAADRSVNDALAPSPRR